MDKLQYVIYSICRSLCTDSFFKGFAKQASISFISLDREIMIRTVSRKKTTGFFFLKNHTLYAQPDCPNSYLRITIFFSALLTSISQNVITDCGMVP